MNLVVISQVPTCRELGIGIVAYSPLCRKLLSGELESKADFGILRLDRFLAGCNSSHPNIVHASLLCKWHVRSFPSPVG